MEVVYYITFFLIGICFGSFFNVVGFRIPVKESIIKPGSHCQTCGHELKWYELIPIISFIIQKGKCRVCKSHLSFFYPFIELSTGLLFVVSFYSYGFSYDLLISLILVSTFMIVIVSDLTYLMIPDRFIVIPSILIFIITLIDKGFINSLLQVLYGLLSFSLMYLIMLLGNKLFNKETLGGADIKLMFLVGLVLDPLLSIIVIFLASIIALPVSLLLLIKNKEHVIPFGPFITLSLLIINFTKLNIKEIFEKVLSFF